MADTSANKVYVVEERNRFNGEWSAWTPRKPLSVFALRDDQFFASRISMVSSDTYEIRFKPYAAEPEEPVTP